MSKLMGALAAVLAALAAPAGAARGAIFGPHVADCSPEAGRPAMLVQVTGFKSRTGLVRVQSYGNPKRFFEKGAWLERVEIPTPANGSVEICMPVPSSGTYAVSVRHDVNGSGKSDMKDGGGLSGNPSVSLTDLIFKRKPDPEEVAVHVGSGVVTVPVVLKYVQGGSVKPIRTAFR
ncbi:hypothetical protein CLG96_16740 [Sphingomonas oleivorans]|uniref:DUF2141 domain-containing protein n=1 Tax=Sphingomonas oleivorans TaxID=1735121 RepID=A0A2T5FU24_9SPHN|nr:DUF2141 domain-containing protein [Sphingomonas oleivorans]PTQ07795.1 hypothetical protein CLG96_16740 [Sphingomonas oleivorans]